MVHLTKPKTFKPIFTVVSCIFKYQNETLIVRRRLDKSQGGKWGMPSGKLDKKESLLSAMAREIKEEVGLETINQDLKYFKKFYVDSSGKQFLYHLFILKLKEKPTIKLNPEEHTEYRWIKIKDIFDYDLVEDHPFCMKYFIKKTKPSNTL